jgi:hypothetical protein
MTTPAKGTLSFAGEYVIEECSMKTQEGVELNFIAQVSGIVIYEDMFSPFISGTIFARDTLDLPNFFGRGGLNLLRLKISTPGLPDRTAISGVFHAYKVADRELTKQREQFYTIRFVSVESIADHTNISKSFRGAPEAIAEQLVRKHLQSKKPIGSNPSSNQINYVSNFWSPTKNLTYVAEHAKRKDGVANYMFFENRDGFNFRNISDIALDTPIQSFSYNDYLTVKRNEAQPEFVVRDPNEDYRKVIDLKVDTVYDFDRDRQAGAIKTSIYAVDTVLKSYNKIRYSMNADKSDRLNANLPYSDTVIALTDNFTETLNRYYGAFNKGDSSNLGFVQARVAQIRRYQSFKVEITVLGRMNYTVGKKVSLQVPLTRNIGPDDEAIDKLYTGDYIISAIAHSFTTDKHLCTIELIKDSTLLK